MLSPVDASGYETRGKIYEALGKKAMAELDFLTARLPEDMRRNLVKTSTASSGASGSASGPRDYSGLIVILGIACLGYFMFKGHGPIFAAVRVRTGRTERPIPSRNQRSGS